MIWTNRNANPAYARVAMRVQIILYALPVATQRRQIRNIRDARSSRALRKWLAALVVHVVARGKGGAWTRVVTMVAGDKREDE